MCYLHCSFINCLYKEICGEWEYVFSQNSFIKYLQFSSAKHFNLDLILNTVHMCECICLSGRTPTVCLCKGNSQFFYIIIYHVYILYSYIQYLNCSHISWINCLHICFFFDLFWYLLEQLILLYITKVCCTVYKMSLISDSLLSASFLCHMDAKIMRQWILFNLGLYSLTSIEPLRGLDTPPKHHIWVETEGVKGMQDLSGRESDPALSSRSWSVVWDCQTHNVKG